jgi:uncharacterized membrane protein YuzA (DUF378 family)
MKTLKVMGITGLVLSALTWIFIGLFDNINDYESAIGWGVIAMFYLIAYSIVGIVQANKK